MRMFVNRRQKSREAPSGWFRGIHFKRTLYRPGFGVCYCPACAKAAMPRHVGSDRESRALGSPVEGCTYVNREAVFQAAWAAEHDRFTDTAQLLMERPLKDGEKRCLFFRGPFAFILNYRDRVIIATVIQWLGSNIGFAFLMSALAACGYEVRRKEKAKEAA